MGNTRRWFPGCDERATVMERLALGTTGKRVYKNSGLFLHFFCKCKTVPKEKVYTYFKNFDSLQ